MDFDAPDSTRMPSPTGRPAATLITKNVTIARLLVTHAATAVCCCCRRGSACRCDCLCFL